MATATQPPINHNKNNKKDFDITRAEVDRLEKALKDENFVKLLTDYARDLADPAKKAEYEREIALLEQERGYDVSFIHPKPGYVIKVEEVGSKKKIFINICSEGQIGVPESVSTCQNGQTGLKWSIPYSLSKPRDDADRSGTGCVVFDAIFHPDTLYLASRDTRIKTLVHNTAFDALLSTFNVQVDPSQVKYPKMKFKGVFHPTVIRKPRVDAAATTVTDEADEHEHEDELEQTVETTLELLEKAVTTTPSYSIKYRSPKDLQDFLIETNDVASSRPKQMIVEIQLPKLDSAADLDLDVQERILSLVGELPPQHKLNIQLPYPVDENNGNAKFDKSKKCLVITLPIKQAAPVMKSVRHSSNDSGIEMEEAASASPVSNDNSENAVDKQSDNIDRVEGYRTGEKEEKVVEKELINGEKASIKSVNKCDKKKKVKSGKSNTSDVTADTTTEADITAAVNDLHINDDESIHDLSSSDQLDNVIQAIAECDDNTGINNIDENNDLEIATTNPNVINEYRTKVGFLDSDISYQLPVFTHTVFDNVMIVTLEVKNVSEESIAHVCFDRWKSVHVKFASIGAGHFPVHHAFYIDFLQVGSFAEEEINVECWDNNIVLQVPWQENMTTFRVGLSSCELKEKEYTVQQSASLELELKSEEAKQGSVRKYAKETHPNFNSPEKQKKEPNDKIKDLLPATKFDTSTTNSTSPKAFTNIRERHGSGESIDSLSMSPYDTVLLEQQHMKHLEQLEEKEQLQETAGESDVDDPRLLERSQSTEEGMLSKQNIYKPRSILKRKNMPNLVGSRFRCYSESNVSEIGSTGQLSLGISEASISEEGESVTKKTVRFKEKAEKRLYRIGSCIIPSNKVLKKRKYERERKRRLSEGDSVELHPASTSSIKPPVQSSGSLDSNTYEQESNDDSGLSSSLEEAMIIGPGGDDPNQEHNGAVNQQDSATQKAKKRTKKRTKTFEMSSDLIFDLDI